MNVWLLVPWLAAYGIGLGMASAQLLGVILSEVPTVHSGQASGIQSTNRQVGSAFGIAVLGTIFATEIGSRTASAVRAIVGVSSATARQVAGIVRASGGATIHPLARFPHGHALMVAASGAVADATRFVSLIGAVFIAVGLVGTLLLQKAAASDGDRENGDLVSGDLGTPSGGENPAPAASLPAAD